MVQLPLLTKSLRGGEFIRLMKVPFWPTYNFVQSSFLPLMLLLSDIKSRQRSRPKMTLSLCPLIGRSQHVDPGNPRQLWICSTFRLAAGNNEQEVTSQTPFAHYLTYKGSGWGKKPAVIASSALYLIASLIISERTLSFVCFYSLDTMTHTDGDQETHLGAYCYIKRASVSETYSTRMVDAAVSDTV